MAKGDLLVNVKVKNQQALGAVNSQLKGLSTSGMKLGTVLKGAGVALAAFGAVKLIGSIITTTARFEDLNDSLASVTGSAEKGAEAFDFVSDFATQTQFGVEDLTTTFIKLKASGIEPTRDLLTLFTDTAAVTTDQIGSLQAMTDLFSRTTSGGLGLEELNRLADRGVPVFRILEEQLGLARLEISNVGKTAEGAKSILNALSKGIRADFGGATARVTDNLSTQFSNFGIALKNTANEIGTEMSPALKDLVADMTKFMEDNEDLLKALGRLGGAILTGVVKLFQSFAVALGHVVVAGEKLIGFLKDVKEDTEDLSTDFADLNGDLMDTGAGFKALLNDMPPVVKQLGDMQMTTEELGASLTEAAEAQFEYNNALGDYEETGKTILEIQKETALEQAAVNRETHRGTIQARESSQAYKNLRSGLQGFNSNLEDMLKNYSDSAIITGTLTNMMNTFATTTESALTDVIMGSKSLKDALGEIGQAIVRDVVGGFIRMAVVAPILAGLAKLLGIQQQDIVGKQRAINSELKKEIALRTVLAFLTGGASIGFGGFFANGGSVTGGQPIVVGEKGPELFVPGSSGSIVSNADATASGDSSGGSTGGDNINVTFNINTIDSTDFNSLLTERQDMIIGMINRGLAERGKRSLTA